jgi:hypothetical protein
MFENVGFKSKKNIMIENRIFEKNLNDGKIRYFNIPVRGW